MRCRAIAIRILCHSGARDEFRASGRANGRHDVVFVVADVDYVLCLRPPVLPASDVDSRLTEAWRLHDAAARISDHDVRHLHQSQVVPARKVAEQPYMRPLELDEPGAYQ